MSGSADAAASSAATAAAAAPGKITSDVNASMEAGASGQLEDVASLKVALEAERARRAKLNESLLKIRERVTSEIARLEGVVASQADELAETRQTIGLLREEGELNTALIKQRENEVVEAKRMAEHALFARDCMQGDIDELQSQVRELETTVQELKEEHAEEIRVLQAKLAAATDAQKAAEAKAAAAAALSPKPARDVESQLSATATTLAALRQELDAERRRCTLLTSEGTQLRQQVASLQASLTEAHAATTKAREAEAAAVAQAAAAVSAAAEAKASAAAAMASTQTAAGANAAAAPTRESDTSRLRAQVAQLQEALSQERVNTAQLQARLLEATSGMEDAQQEARDAREAEEDALAGRAALERELRSLQTLLEDSGAARAKALGERREALSSLSSAVREKERLATQVAQLNADVAALREALAAAPGPAAGSSGSTPRPDANNSALAGALANAEAATAAAAAAEERAARLAAQLEETRAALAVAEAEAAASREEAGAATQAEVAQLKAQLQAAAVRAVEAEAAAAAARVREDRATMAVAAATSSVTPLREQMQALQTAHAAELQAMQSQHASALEAAVAAARASATAAAAQGSSVDGQGTGNSAEQIALLTKRLAEAQAAHKAADDDLGHATEFGRMLIATNKSLTAECQALRAQLAAAHGGNAALMHTSLPFASDVPQPGGGFIAHAHARSGSGGAAERLASLSLQDLSGGDAALRSVAPSGSVGAAGGRPASALSMSQLFDVSVLRDSMAPGNAPPATSVSSASAPAPAYAHVPAPQSRPAAGAVTPAISSLPSSALSGGGGGAAAAAAGGSGVPPGGQQLVSLARDMERLTSAMQRNSTLLSQPSALPSAQSGRLGLNVHAGHVLSATRVGAAAAAVNSQFVPGMLESGLATSASPAMLMPRVPPRSPRQAAAQPPMLPQYVPVTSRGATLAGASSSSSSSSSSSVVGGGRNAVASPRGSAFAAERAPWGELALPAGHTPRGGSAYMPRSLSSPRSGGVGGAGSGFGVGAVSGAVSGAGIPSVATVAGSIQTERARRMAAENEVRELQRALAATQIQAP